MSKNKTKINKKDLCSLINQSTFLSKKDKKAWLFLVPNLTNKNLQRLYKELSNAQKDQQILLLRLIYENKLGNKFLSTLSRKITKIKRMALAKNNNKY